MNKISFVKPTCKRAVEQSSSHSSTAVPAPKKNCVIISGPQDAPKLSSDTLYKSLFKVVPEACLFTIINEPVLEDNNTPANLSLHHFESSEQSSIVSGEQTDAVNAEQSDPVCGEQTDAVNVEQSDSLCGEQTDAVNVEQSDPVCGEQTDAVNVEQSDPVSIEQTDVMSDEAISTESGKPTFPMPLMQFFKEKLTSTAENDLSTITKHLYFSLILTADECLVIEKVTRSQRESEEWFKHREGRLTASSFHSILTLRKQTNPENLVQRILTAQDISHVPAVQWGNSNENTARQEYIEKMSSHESLTCTAVGLVVNPLYPHLGASPDGIVHCNCCGKGLVEIKCPYSARDLHPDALRGKSQSCLTERGVSTSHPYYTQIQGQLFITELDYCDLVIWTKKGMVIERIYADINFSEKLLKKLTDFYIDIFLPKFLQLALGDFLPTITQQRAQPKLYCLCQKVESGQMVMCDNPNCPYGWFHFECVGIKRAPARHCAWYCSHCKARK